MRIRWSPEAAEDLQFIFEFISLERPTAAQKVVSAIFDAITTLTNFPHRGRLGTDKNRELVLYPYPYIAIYQVQAQTVYILHIYHSAQNWTVH